MRQHVVRSASIRTTRAGERGQAAVEFAIVLPFLMVIVLGIIRVGTFYSQYQTLTQATAQAARTEAICKTGVQDANSVGVAAAGALNPVPTFTFVNTATSLSVSHAPSCAITSGTQIKVTGSSPNASINLYLFTITLPLSSSVTVIEE